MAVARAIRNSISWIWVWWFVEGIGHSEKNLKIENWKSKIEIENENWKLKIESKAIVEMIHSPFGPKQMANHNNLQLNQLPMYANVLEPRATMLSIVLKLFRPISWSLRNRWLECVVQTISKRTKWKNWVKIFSKKEEISFHIQNIKITI